MDAVENTLADMARADGLHDFGPLGPRKDDVRTEAFEKSIVGVSANNWSDENIVLDAVFTTGGVRGMWEALPDGGEIPMPRVITGHQYTVKRVVFVGTAKTGSQLVDEAKLNGTVLQVDFNHHGFLARLKQGPSAPEKKVGYIWSAATINDPASKTPPTDPIFDKGGSGVTMTSYRQVSETTLFPGGNKYTPESALNNFVSAYDVELSGIQSKMSFGRRSKEFVTIRFTDPKTKQTTLISDSKGQNSPAQLGKFITKLLAKLGSAQARFDLSTKWMQKRSGDWLQVLLAALLRQLTFDPPLPKDIHVFFVSHDRIAIAYALAMGVSCLYFSGDSVYVFDNRPQNPAAKLDYCMRELVTYVTLNPDGSRDRTAQGKNIYNWFFGNPGMNNTCNISRGEQQRRIEENCTKIESGVNIRSLADLEGTIKEILEDALKHSFLDQSFPDADVLSRETQDPDICVSHKAYALLDSLYKRHGENPGNTALPNTFYGQFKRTAVYKTATDWAIEPKISLANRLLAFTTRPEEIVIRDAFAFFPFIQNSKNIAMKNRIVAAFKRLESIPDEVLNRLGARTPSRIARVRLGLNNLTTQAGIYLASTVIPDPAMSGIASAFVKAVDTPSAAPDVADDGNLLPAFANRLTLPQVTQLLGADQGLPDSTPEAPMAGGGQLGGWAPDKVMLLFGTELDFDQNAEPLLMAFVDYYNWLGRYTEAEREAALIVARRRALQNVDAERAMLSGGRRPLYGGVVSQTMTITEAPKPVDNGPSIVINALLLVATKRILRDTDKLLGAPPDVLEYYYKAVALLTKIFEQTPTADLALATRDLLTNCVYMTDADIMTGLGIADEQTARVYRLFFSALEEAPLITRPENPAGALLKSKEVFSKLWASIGTLPAGATAEMVQNMARGLFTNVVTRVGVEAPKFPGMGIPLELDAKADKTRLTPEGLRAARIARLTQSAGQRLGARRTRRKKKSTSP